MHRLHGLSSQMREQETRDRTPVVRRIYPRIGLGRINPDPYGLSFEGIRE
jgi:hypothetical protein